VYNKVRQEYVPGAGLRMSCALRSASQKVWSVRGRELWYALILNSLLHISHSSTLSLLHISHSRTSLTLAYLSLSHISHPRTHTPFRKLWRPQARSSKPPSSHVAAIDPFGSSPCSQPRQREEQSSGQLMIPMYIAWTHKTP
jgi:hypothetical protein